MGGNLKYIVMEIVFVKDTNLLRKDNNCEFSTMFAPYLVVKNNQFSLLLDVILKVVVTKYSKHLPMYWHR